MTTAKTTTTQPSQSASAQTTPVSKPIAAKQPAKKVTPRKASSKKTPIKKPLSKAFAATKTTKPVKRATTVKTVKLEKPKKPKLVRDSFTMPKIEYAALAEMKQRAVKLTRPVKKSELLRAAIKTLASLSDAALLSALDKVPAIKTGRPATKK